MSATIRILLFTASVITCIYIARKLRKSQIQVMDTVFWIFVSIVFIVLSIFPNIATWFAEKLGFMATVNFIFLLIIFLLLIRCFLLSIRISQIDNKLDLLVEELALREHRNRSVCEHKDDWHTSFFP